MSRCILGDETGVVKALIISSPLIFVGQSITLHNC